MVFVVGQEALAGELLGDRRSALRRLRDADVGDAARRRCARDRARVIDEALVLDGEDGLHQASARSCASGTSMPALLEQHERRLATHVVEHRGARHVQQLADLCGARRPEERVCGDDRAGAKDDPNRDRPTAEVPMQVMQPRAPLGHAQWRDANIHTWVSSDVVPDLLRRGLSQSSAMNVSI